MPNFGNESIEATAQSPIRIVYSRHTLSEDGDVESITVYIHTNGVTIDVQCALYDNTSPDDPNNFLGGTEIRSLNISSGSPGWYTFNFASPVSLTAGEYWITLSGENTSNTLRWYVGAVATGDTHYSNTSVAPWPDPADIATRQDRIMSIYATYTTGGGIGSGLLNSQKLNRVRLIG